MYQSEEHAVAAGAGVSRSAAASRHSSRCTERRVCTKENGQACWRMLEHGGAWARARAEQTWERVRVEQSEGIEVYI